MLRNSVAGVVLFGVVFALLVFGSLMQERLIRKLGLSFSFSSLTKMYRKYFEKEFYLSLLSFLAVGVIVFIVIMLG